MTASGESVAYVAITTVATVVMIALGFLPRPSWATGLWSIAFTLSMSAAYVSVGAVTAGSALLQALASGLFLAANAYIWLGLRAFRGAARVHHLTAGAYLVLSPLVLVLTAETPLYAWAFRIDFVVAAAFAALIALELIRLGPADHDELLPLLLGSGAFVPVALFVVSDGVIQITNGNPAADELSGVRDVNSVAVSVYVTCALLTLLLLARRTRADTPMGGRGVFVQVASDRLARAEAVGDSWWSMVDVRLDDPAALRAAFGTTAAKAVTDGFRTAVLAALPADADIDERSPTTIVALVARPEDSMRQLLAQILERVSDPLPEQRVPVIVSASIGWAEVSTVGYRFDDLVAAAAEANAAAKRGGGDRWERAAALPDETVSRETAG